MQEMNTTNHNDRYDIEVLEKNAVRKIIHDMRSHMGVIQTYLEVSQARTQSISDSEFLLSAKESLNELVQVTNRLSETLRGQRALIDTDLIPQMRCDSSLTDHQDILVIDDDDNIRFQFTQALAKKGMRVIALEKGEDLLDHRIDFKNISTAVVDFQFENSSLDGFDIIEYLTLQKVKRIHLCTGQYDDPEVSKKAKDLGVTSIISKPVTDKVWTLF